MFFPILPFILHLVVLCWFAVVALSITSMKQDKNIIHFKNNITPSCLQKCINPATENTYKSNDICDSATFNQTCIDCPEIICKSEKLDGGWFSNWMTWYNFFGMLWAMEFVSAFGEMVLAGMLISSSTSNMIFIINMAYVVVF